MSYLVAVGEKLRTPALTLDEQSAIVGRLRGAAGNPDASPEEREGAVTLLREMRSRDDLYHSVAVEIGRALEEVPAPTTASTAGSLCSPHRWPHRLVSRRRPRPAGRSRRRLRP